MRASIDHFYRPGHIHRAAAGAYTPRSYYDEACDFTVFPTDFLGPLGPGGDHRVRLASWQMWPDLPASDARVAVDAEAIALVDGVFLLRPELRPHWDLVVWLEVRVDLALVRALERDIALAGSAEAVCARYEHRNFPAHDLYVHDTGGAAAADIVIDNSDPQRPILLRRSGRFGELIAS